MLGSEDTPICNFLKHTRCLENARIVMAKFNQVEANCDKNSLDKLTYSGCNCLSPCNEITYETEIIKNEFKVSPNSTASDIMYLTDVKVMFKENEFLAIRRSERYGFIDFISNCGGLMGLFMGISTFCVFEIFYYFVYHSICKLCGRDRRVHDVMQ
jgi:hypothetical protein